MELGVILAAVGVVALIILLLVIRWLIISCALTCLNNLFSCCCNCFLDNFCNKKDKNESLPDQSEKPVEDSDEFAIFTTRKPNILIFN